MAGVCLLALTAAFLLEGLAAEITEENTGKQQLSTSMDEGGGQQAKVRDAKTHRKKRLDRQFTSAVFVSQQAAHAVLHRQRRYNSHQLEEIIHKDNLERECKEETCSFEEAREVFENHEKAMEFWAGYIDGDQCKPNPCQNEGVCQDGIGSYICWCESSFSGKNCEIEVAKQCTINNGGCSHFCKMQGDIPVCRCAAGYILDQDKSSCKPTGPFSCGQVNLSPTIRSRFSVNPRASNGTASFQRSFNSSEILQDDYSDDNTTQLYDYYDLPANDSDIPVAPHVRLTRSDSACATGPCQSDSTYSEPVVTDEPGIKLEHYFPTLPTITAKKNSDQRIVGGNEATPGEIPWQVTLMTHSASLGRGQPFCGGSLLSEFWVITAAHCLVAIDGPKKVFFVRVGEHDVNVHEGSEKDHLVAEQHIHPRYDAKKSLYNHDIALLKLATPVELSNQRHSICLGPKDFTEGLLRESSNSMVSGWGRLMFQGALSSKLQKLEVPYVERTHCKQSSRYHITRFMFCAGYKTEEKDSCQGDSGGPHATKFKDTWFLTGIVSWGEECAKDEKYGIYTRVSQYYPWISQTTGIQTNN